VVRRGDYLQGVLSGLSYIKVKVMEELQQVMGPHADRVTCKELVPKFKFDGGDPGVFLREFPVVASAFGVTTVYHWEYPDDAELDEEREKKNTLALLVLRQYLTDKVLKIIMVDNPRLACTVYRALSTMFFSTDARTKVQVTRELQRCEMGVGESLQDFLARINGLIEEATVHGEIISPENRMVLVATRLREPWRQQANDKMDRDPNLTYATLIQHLVMRQRGEVNERSIDAYVSTAIHPGEWEGQSSRQFGKGNGYWSRGKGPGRFQNNAARGFRGRGLSNSACANCGEEGHWRRACPKPQRCNRCGRQGHLSYECAQNGRMVSHTARLSVVDDLKDKEDSHGHVEFLYMATHLYKTLGTGAFLLDGAATVHMVEDWVELQDERVVQMQVKGVGNMMATAKGSLCVGGMKLQPALRVPGLGINLISEGLLQQQGFEVVSRDNWRRFCTKVRW
jgi:hypothetical protein